MPRNNEVSRINWLSLPNNVGLLLIRAFAFVESKQRPRLRRLELHD